jgi:tripartite-type tricarboxylate transporter receptor subunit TctC
MISRRCFLTASTSASIASVLPPIATPAHAQVISRNARLVVGFPPGGSLDTVARLLVEQMKDYAPSFIVDNQPGAGGRIALDALKGSDADGSVVVLTPGDQITLFPHVYRKLNYNPLQDFAAVTTVCTFPFLLTIGPMVPASVTTLAEFVEWCRTNPKLATYGSAGAGTRPHFLGATLARDARFEFVHVPYKGGAPAIQDLIGGQISATVSVFSNAFPHVQSGKLRALATTAPRRSGLLPHVPTVREAGFASVEAVEWFGLFAPAKTPAGIVRALDASVRRALGADTVKAGLAKQAFDVADISPEDFSKLIKADTERWGELVKTSGFTPME